MTFLAELAAWAGRFAREDNRDLADVWEVVVWRLAVWGQ